MEYITSRKNPLIQHLRGLGRDRAYRQQQGEYLCDGEKLLEEALQWGAEITAVLQGNTAVFPVSGVPVYTAPQELIAYVSPLKNSPGPVFSVKIPEKPDAGELRRVLVLEGVQDPGNVGTVVRSAGAFEMDAVILLEGCADLYNPKTVRSTMGGIFRQRVMEMDIPGLRGLLSGAGLKLYGAALSPDSRDLRQLHLESCAVAIGSEGRGLSPEMLGCCDELLIIPMNSKCESLNAAVAASVVMWEMYKQN